jgi:beta-lactamase class A
MTRLQSVGGASASLGGISLVRRGVLLGGGSLALAGCSGSKPLTASRTPALKMDKLNSDVGAIAKRVLPAILGVGLMNLESGQHFTLAGDRRFPMHSVMKLPLAAAVLSEVDHGRLSLAETLLLTAKELSPDWSPIADAWPGRSAYTVQELLTAAVSDSDNTAADLLMKRIGGPGVVSAWLQEQKITEIRVDRYARELLPEVLGMASFRPAWKGTAAFAAARDTVPLARRRAATLAYMADPRDTATPEDMLNFLSKLDAGEMLSIASSRRLLALMTASPRDGERLKAGLPKDATFAHQTGTAGTDQGLASAYNDVGILALHDHRRYAAAAFLSGSTTSVADRAALFAELGRAMAASLG